MTTLAIKERGSRVITLTSREVKWANGTEFTQYTVSLLRKDMRDSVTDTIRHYKKLGTAQRNFNRV